MLLRGVDVTCIREGDKINAYLSYTRTHHSQQRPSKRMREVWHTFKGVVTAGGIWKFWRTTLLKTPYRLCLEPARHDDGVGPSFVVEV